MNSRENLGGPTRHRSFDGLAVTELLGQDNYSVPTIVQGLVTRYDD